MNKQAIKQLVEQPAFQYIEDMFMEEIVDGKKPLNFKTEGKTAEMIALEAMAREKASKMVINVLNKLRRIKNSQEYGKESFK
jgi:hypothetical protein